MPIYHLPPSPFVGGRQPLAPKDLNPAFEAVDDPSPRRRAVFAAILIAWQPVDIPQQRQVHTPQVAVVAEGVPYTSQLSIILNSWREAAPTVQIYRKVPIIEAAVVSDFVPYTSRLAIILNSWRDTSQFIQLPSNIASEVITDYVPYARPQLYIYLDAVNPPYQGKGSALIAVAAPAVDNPPFGQRTWLNTVLTGWRPPQFNIVKPIQLPQEVVISPVDNPPFGRRVLWLNTVMDAWIPPPPIPTNPIIIATPPTSIDIIIWMWKRVL